MQRGEAANTQQSYEAAWEETKENLRAFRGKCTVTHSHF